jgi:hypothetical protein
LIAFLTLLAQLILVPTAYAHRPDKGRDLGITPIPSVHASYAYYRELTSSSPLHIYQVEAEAGDFFHAGVQIPQLDGLETYGVNLLLIGPGMPEIDLQQEYDSIEDEHGIEIDGHDHNLEAEVAKEVAAAITDLDLPYTGGILLKSVISQDFFEPFTQTRYWGRQTLEMNLSQSGTYYLFVWQPTNTAGKYVLDTGTQEVFGIGDLFRFPIWWIETRIYFGQGPFLVGMMSIFAAGVLGFVLRRKFRRARVD